MTLGNNEKKMLRCMRSKQENIWTLEELLEITQWNDQVHVAGAGKSLDENEFVEQKDEFSQQLLVQRQQEVIENWFAQLYDSAKIEDNRHQFFTF